MKFVKLSGVLARGAAASLLLGMGAMSHGGVVSTTEYQDTNCAASGSARHGGSRGGCAMVMDGSFGVSQAPANRGAGSSSFIVPFNAGGPSAAQAVPPIAQLGPQKPEKPAPVTAIVLAPNPSAEPKVQPSAIMPPAAPVPAAQVEPQAPVAAAPLAAVSEPASGLLLLGGLAALVGLRKRRVR